jgi:hypothetical protein
MADRQFECPVPRIPEFPPTLAQAAAELGRIALKWRALAERRREHFLELQRSGRWNLYYDYPDFIRELRGAIALAQRWAKITPPAAAEAEGHKDERKAPAGLSQAKAA